MLNNNDLFKRITYNPEIFNGKPIIRGMRIAVEHILGMMGNGSTIEDILEGYPLLEREDIQACILYAYKIVSNERIEIINQ